MKIAPETALKLTFNDAIKHVVASDPEYITAAERMVGGAIAGAAAQVTCCRHGPCFRCGDLLAILLLRRRTATLCHESFYDNASLMTLCCTC